MCPSFGVQNLLISMILESPFPVTHGDFMAQFQGQENGQRDWATLLRNNICPLIASHVHRKLMVGRLNFLML